MTQLILVLRRLIHSEMRVKSALFHGHDDAVPSERTPIKTVRIAPATCASQVVPNIFPAVASFDDVFNRCCAADDLASYAVHSFAEPKIVNVKIPALVLIPCKHFNAAIATSPVLCLENLEAEFLGCRFVHVPVTSGNACR